MTIKGIDVNAMLIILAPFVQAATMMMFVLSRKWMHDKILLVSVVATLFCLLSFSTGHTTLAIIIILTSNNVLVLYSMFIRRRNLKDET